MNLRGGIALIKKSFFSYIASRGFYWTLALGWMMTPLIYMFVWVVIAGQGSVSGFEQSDFISYYTILIFVNQLTYPISHWTVGDNIFNGTFSTWLLRPLPVIYEPIAADIALKIACAPFIVIFIVIIVFLFGFRLSLTITNFLLFIVSLILAQVLRFMFGYTLALLGLITSKINSFLSVNDILVHILAGQIIPTILLPGIIRHISVFTPFRYMLGFPIELIQGKLSAEQINYGLIIQLIWIIIVIIVNRFVWSRGIKHYSSIGG
ncbi:hypothetical protein acsn021_24250 [Anaerocolumna cellulosilytica]|uniref:Uncharacterized protein n=1 Tax=Anaerocolumna cellulosilytica TaxID=433286 RepID=A0A6S6QYL8_9FIRM|nr:ABC-2 family transporter protein [Anaerocolumna cellulosilytica]MBB5193930.1 ABC-2 type transport system permease protein [Anaerocolumna cellulosilytica]BCJ94856.1 hypothetical protein acsn021_24250 [Anaerocolumna cellulosilytica]